MVLIELILHDKKEIKRKIDELKHSVQKELKELDLKEELKIFNEHIKDILLEVHDIKLFRALDLGVKVQDSISNEYFSIEKRGHGLQRFLVLALLNKFNKLNATAKGFRESFQ